MTGLRVWSSSIAGRGVFAERPFRAGELVERCEILRVPASQVETIQSTVLNHHLVGSDDGSGDVFIPLGNGSFYNHSDDANAEYVADGRNDLFVVTARRAINPGDEVTVAYLRPWVLDGRSREIEETGHGPAPTRRARWPRRRRRPRPAGAPSEGADHGR